MKLSSEYSVARVLSQGTSIYPLARLVATALVLLCAVQCLAQPGGSVRLDADNSPVYAVAYTPDGRLIATGGPAGEIVLWDASTGEALRSLPSEQQMVLSLAVSPDGFTLASGGSNNTVRLWDVPVETPQFSWPGHEGPINDLAVSGDGRFALSAGEDRVVRLWDRSDGTLLRAVEGHASEVTRVGFRSDGRQWGTGDAEGVLRLWTPNSFLDEVPVVSDELLAHEGPITGVAFHPNNQSLLTCSGDGTVKQWKLPITSPLKVVFAPEVAPVAEPSPSEAAMSDDTLVATSSDGQLILAANASRGVNVFSLADGRHLRRLEGQSGPATALGLSADNTLVVTGDQTGKLKFWSVSDGADRLSTLGHIGPVRDVAFHPNGQQVASAGDDGTIRVWRLPAAPLELAGHDESVTSLAVSPNGQTLLTTAADKTARLWNLSNGQPMQTLAAHDCPLNAATIRSDGSQAATGDNDGGIRFWNVADGTAQGSLGAHTAAVTSITYHPAGSELLTTDAAGIVKLWDLPLSTPKSLDGHSEPVESVALSSDGKLVVSGGADQTMRLFDVATGDMTRQLAEQAGAVTAVALSPDDSIAAAATSEGRIVLRQVSDAADRLHLAGHSGRVEAIDFHPERPQLVSAGADGSVRVWRLPEPPTLLTGHTMPVLAAAAAGDDSLIATAGQDNSIRLWNPTDGQTTGTLQGHMRPVQAVAFRPDSGQLASGDAEGLLRLWNLDDSTATSTIGGHQGPIRSVAYHSTGTRLLTGSDDGTIKLWMLPDVPAKTFAEHSDSVQALAASQNGRTVVSGGADGSIRVLDVAEGKKIRVLDGQLGGVTALALKGDDSELVSGSDSGHVKSWSLRDGTAGFEFQAHPVAVTDVACHPDPAMGQFATTGADGTLRVWRAPTEPVSLNAFGQQVTSVTASGDGALLATSGVVNNRPAVVLRDARAGRHVTTLLGHGGTINAMQFSGDAKRLVTASADGTARVWDLTDPKYPELVCFDGHAGSVTSVTFNADGTRVLSGADDKTLKLWSVANVDEAQDVAGHSASAVAVAVAATTLVSAADTTVRFWNPANAQAVRSISVGANVTAMAVSGDGTQVAVAAAPNILRVYAAASAQLVHELTGHAAVVQTLTFSADGQRLASGSVDGEIRVWDAKGRLLETRRASAAAAGEPTAPSVVFGADSSLLVANRANGSIVRVELALRHLIPASDTALTSLAYTPSGDGIVAGGGDHSVRLWATTDGSLVRQFSGHADSVTSVAVTADAKKVLAGSTDQTVRIWNLADGQPIASLAQPTAVHTIALSGDDRRLSVAGDDGIVRVWDLDSARQLQHFSGHAGVVAASCFGLNGETVVSGGMDKTVRAWKISATRVLVPGEGDASVGQVAFLGDSDRFVSLSTEGFVRLWNEAGEQTSELKAAGTLLTSLGVDPTGVYVAAGGDDQKVYVWSVANGQLAVTIDTPAAIHRIAYSSDSGKLLVGGADSHVRFFDAADGRLLEEVATAAPATALAPLSDDRRFVAQAETNNAAVYRSSLVDTLPKHGGPVTGAVYTPDGARLVTAGEKNPVRIWDSQSGQLLTTLTGLVDSVTSLSISADGKRVVAGSSGNSVLIWEVDPVGNAAPLATFTHSSPVRSVACSADGMTIAASGDEGIIRVWDVASGYELERFAGHEGQVLELDFAPQGRTIVSAGADHSVRVWNISASRVAKAHQGAATAARYLGDGSRFATSGDDATVRVWDQEGQTLFELTAGSVGFNDLVIHDQASQVTTGSADGRIYTWSLADGALASTITAPAPVTSLWRDAERNRLAAACADGQLRIYSTVEGRLLEQLAVVSASEDDAAPGSEDAPEPPASPARPTSAMRVVMTPDGEAIAVTTGARVHVYQPSLLRLIEGHEGAVTGVAFTPAGTELLSGGADNTARLWGLDDGAEIQAYAGNTDDVTDVAVTADGRKVLSASLDGAVRVWDIQPEADQSAESESDSEVGAPLLVLSHPQSVRGVCPSANGLRVATACDDGSVRVWDVATGRQLERFASGAAPAISVAFAADNSAVVSGTATGQTNLWRITATRVLSAHDGPVNAIANTATGTQFATAGEDGYVNLWDQNFGLVRRYGAPVMAAEGSDEVDPADASVKPLGDSDSKLRSLGRLTALAIRPDGQVIAAGGDSGTIYLWRAANEELLRTIETPSPVVRVAFSADNQKLAATGADRSVRVYAAEDGTQLQHLTAESEIRVAAFAPDGRQLLTGGDDPLLHTWRFISPTSIRTLTGHGGSVLGLAFDPNGGTLASCSTDGSIRTWNVDAGNQTALFAGHEGPVAALAYGPDGALLASAGEDATVRLWDVDGARQLKQLAAGDGAIDAVAFSTDGKTIAAGGLDKHVHLFDALSGKRLRTLEGGDNFICSVRFSPQGGRVAACGYGGGVWIWNSADGVRLMEAVPARVAHGADYSPDGRQIVVAGDDAAHVLSLPADAQ